GRLKMQSGGFGKIGTFSANTQTLVFRLVAQQIVPAVALKYPVVLSQRRRICAQSDKIMARVPG
ncbi:MAG: hypothetical protein P8X46_05720, partial [Nitrospirales bacterium]